jgi:hemerythrin-like domain-containing protein
MNAIELLESQHREVEDLFERFENSDQAAVKRKLVEEISDKLAVHAAIEEQHFYPAVKDEETEDLLMEALEEHLSVKRVLADLLDLKPADETFEPKVKVLKEQIEHHVDEEEEELFPKVTKLLSTDQLEALGQEMTATQVELEAERKPREAVREETDEAAPLT